MKYLYFGAFIINTLIASSAAAQLLAGAAAIEITPKLCHDAVARSEGSSYDERRACFRWMHLAGFSPYVPFRNDARLATLSVAIMTTSRTIEMPGKSEESTGAPFLESIAQKSVPRLPAT